MFHPRRQTIQKQSEESLIFSSVAAHGDPCAGSGTLFNRFAKHHFVISGFECRKRSRGFQVACFDVFVKITEELNEGIRVALRMPARIGGITARLGA